MKLKELASVLAEDACRSAEVRMETNTRNSGYDILCQGVDSLTYGDKEIDLVYPVMFNGERHPSIVIWVKSNGK